MISTEKELPIRPYDVDMAGIVSNIVYVRWLEDLRMALLHEFFDVPEMLERGLMPVVVRTEIDYRASLRFLNRCTGRMDVAAIGRTSATMRATFRNESGAVAAEAVQIGVFVDTRTGKPVPLPDEMRALFEEKREE
ncbi:MAG TPA: thioesterase family protein [Pyrinomonadaceae bacterium]